MTGRIVRLLFLFLSVTVPDLDGEERWRTLFNCHYLTKRANDGDSFHVRVGDREYIFRLYFVDAPETDSEFRERVAEQARYFGASAAQIVTVGHLAKTFTREKLIKPFVVRTRWEDAMGRSRAQRFYAIVQTATGDLGEELVENGLARIHGIHAEPEGRAAAHEEWQKLKALERKAKREKAGGWGATEGRGTTRRQKQRRKKRAREDSNFKPSDP